MASVFHHLLAALCVADLVFLLSLVVVSPVISSSISSIPIIYKNIIINFNINGFKIR